MGVKFNREYSDIVTDLSKAISEIPDSYAFFEMTEEDWSGLDADERSEVFRTLSDDVFYGLGSSPSIKVGSGQIEYDPKSHVIKVTAGAQVVQVVRLI